MLGELQRQMECVPTYWLILDNSVHADWCPQSLILRACWSGHLAANQNSAHISAKPSLCVWHQTSNSKSSDASGYNQKGGPLNLIFVLLSLITN